MSGDEVLLQRVSIRMAITYEQGSEDIAVGIFLYVLSQLAHDGVEPRRATHEITGPTTTLQGPGPTASAPVATTRERDIMRERVAALLELNVGQEPAAQLDTADQLPW